MFLRTVSCAVPMYRGPDAKVFQSHFARNCHVVFYCQTHLCSVCHACAASTFDFRCPCGLSMLRGVIFLIWAWVRLGFRIYIGGLLASRISGMGPARLSNLHRTFVCFQDLGQGFGLALWIELLCYGLNMLWMVVDCYG